MPPEPSPSAHHLPLTLVPDIADQLQTTPPLTLPHLLYLLPTAPLNRDALARAWFAPVGLSSIPPPRPELAASEDEDGMLRSLRTIESLIDKIHTEQSIPLSRIVLGGFSQGCAMALLLALTSEEYAGKLAGVVGLMGYLPLGAGRVREMRRENGLGEKVGGEVRMMLARGGGDRVLPGWVWRRTLGDLVELGVDPEVLLVGEFEGVGHAVSGSVLEQVKRWLEKCVPNLEGKEE